MSNPKITKEEFTEAMHSVMDAVLDKKQQEILEGPIFKHLVGSCEMPDNPEEFYHSVVCPIEDALEEAVSLMHPSAKSYFIYSVYARYQFYEAHLGGLCRDFYGHACCTDRARFLIQAAVQWVDTEELPVFNWDQEYTYHMPPSGSPKQWMDLIDGIYLLQQGRWTKYALAMDALLKAHKEWESKKGEE